jgi:biopolymer transport protein ExbB
MGSSLRHVIALLRSGYEDGGWMIQPLLFCLCLTLALGTERALFFWRSRRRAQPLLDALERALREGDVASAIAIAARAEGPMSRIALITLSESMRPMERMGAASEAQLIVELPKLFRFTHLLAMLRQLGTLLGLFGTITGISQPGFSSVATADAVSRATQLAHAVGEAMNCTALGLLVSTSAMAVAWVALRRGEDIQDELRLFTTGLQNLLITYRHRLRWNDARCDVEATSYR